MKLRASMQTYRRLMQASKQYLKYFLLGILGTIMLSGIDAMFSWLIKPLINHGFIHRNASFIEMIPIYVILIFALRGIAGFLSNYFISRVARNVVRDFRRQIFQKLLRLPATYYDHHSSGHLLSTIIYNVEQVATASSEALVTVLRESTLFIGLIFVMFVVSWKLSLVFLVVSPFIFWVVKWSSSRMRRLSGNVQQSVGEVTHVADEGIQGYKVIRLFGGQEYEYTKFHGATKRNQQRELKIVVTNSVGTALVQFLIALPISAVLFLATMPSMHVTAGSFAAVITAMVMLLRPVRRLTMVNSDIQKGIAGAESIFEILDESIERDEGTRTLDRARGHIQLENVEFAYTTSKAPVLKNISLDVHSGKTIAIVGRSGSGKTTLVNLLPRFYEINQGSLKIDGVDVREYTLGDLRKQFALVSQDPALFNDTIANNIAYGMTDISQDEIEQAARLSHAMEFIEQLPDGFNTVVGEDGVLLSGGQRQRIAIARALIKDSPILILDEATSALDTESERLIQQAFEQLMHQRTTFVIAHRLSTIENADWIVVMERGEIVEQGTHVELLKREGAYARLHRMQFKDHGNTQLEEAPA